MILVGDCLEVLKTLDAESVQTCISSPPYFGLRDYKVEGQIGLEKSLDEFIQKLVAVYREVRRVLHPTGTCWINMGESYANDGKWGGSTGGKHAAGLHGETGVGRQKVTTGYSPLDLMGIPWRLAEALRSDGWLLRSCVVWAKPNPMPESVSGWRWEKCRVKTTGYSRREDRDAFAAAGAGRVQHVDERLLAEWQDCPGCKKCEKNDGLVLRKGSWRPTQAHEYVFMFAKGAGYYADGEGVREPHARLWDADNGGSMAAHKFNGDEALAGRAAQGNNHRGAYPLPNPGGRNLRSVWTIPTAPFPGSHFATYPPALVRPMLLSSTPDAGVCGKCGTPWARVVEKSRTFESGSGKAGNLPGGKNGHGLQGGGATLDIRRGPVVHSNTHGWRPSCSCGVPAVAAVVLDCFAGSGTTGCVAKEAGRRFIGIELNESYAEMAEKRIAEWNPETGKPFRSSLAAGTESLFA